MYSPNFRPNDVTSSTEASSGNYNGPPPSRHIPENPSTNVPVYYCQTPLESSSATSPRSNLSNRTTPPLGGPVSSQLTSSNLDIPPQPPHLHPATLPTPPSGSGGVMTRSRTQRYKQPVGPGDNIKGRIDLSNGLSTPFVPTDNVPRKRGRPVGSTKKRTDPTSQNAAPHVVDSTYPKFSAKEPIETPRTGKKRRTSTWKNPSAGRASGERVVSPCIATDRTAVAPLTGHLNGSTLNISGAPGTASTSTTTLRQFDLQPSITHRKPIKPAEPAIKTHTNKDGYYNVTPGQDFTKRFKIIQLLGQGTFGRVAECYDRTTHRRCAVKIIRSLSKYRDAARGEIRILQHIREKDPENKFRCIQLRDTFEYRSHICMVFDLLGMSMFDFLKSNEFHAFPMSQIQHFTQQVLRAVAFLHGLKLVHTDLKPENILLHNTDYRTVTSYRGKSLKMKMLLHTDIQLIDFGSATFNDDVHSSVVSTRHYRAPEIILGLGWSYPCDMWSVGCILMELFTGDALFQTHDDTEHLVMMEKVLGSLPRHMVTRASDKAKSSFTRSGALNYPTPDTKPSNRENVRRLRPLRETVGTHVNQLHATFYDLLKKLLTYEPSERLTAADALNHPFLHLPLDANGNIKYSTVDSSMLLAQSPTSVVPSPLSSTSTTLLGTPRMTTSTFTMGNNGGFPELASPSFLLRSQLPSFLQPNYGRAAIGAPSPRFPPSGRFLASMGNCSDPAAADNYPPSPYGGTPMGSARSLDIGHSPSSRWLPIPMQHNATHPTTFGVSRSEATAQGYSQPSFPLDPGRLMTSSGVTSGSITTAPNGVGLTASPLTFTSTLHTPPSGSSRLAHMTTSGSALGTGLSVHHHTGPLRRHSLLSNGTTTDRTEVLSYPDVFNTPRTNDRGGNLPYSAGHAVRIDTQSSPLLPPLFSGPGSNHTEALTPYTSQWRSPVSLGAYAMNSPNVPSSGPPEMMSPLAKFQQVNNNTLHRRSLLGTSLRRANRPSPLSSLSGNTVGDTAELPVLGLTSNGGGSYCHPGESENRTGRVTAHPGYEPQLVPYPQGDVLANNNSNCSRMVSSAQDNPRNTARSVAGSLSTTPHPPPPQSPYGNPLTASLYSSTDFIGVSHESHPHSSLGNHFAVAHERFDLEI
ncbi:serine threonine protein kinase CMGC group [Dispira simplex]|nr:serine threonine protein kinase CMGC group [Dispira simplex]